MIHCTRKNKRQRQIHASLCQKEADNCADCKKCSIEVRAVIPKNFRVYLNINVLLSAFSKFAHISVSLRAF